MNACSVKWMRSWTSGNACRLKAAYGLLSVLHPLKISMGIIAPKKRSDNYQVIIAFLLIVFSPFLVAAVLVYFLWGMLLYTSIWLTWQRRLVIFVYSDSPTWKEYIEREILPPVKNRVVILNWSERRKWKNSLAVLAFRYFGGHRDFNPIAMVFRPFRFVKTYRFFKAFQELKQGDSRAVEELRQELFRDLEVQKTQ